jgi:hypothetical protein
MKNQFIFSILLLLFIGCGPKQKKLSEAEIDQIVNNISDPEHLYDIAQSLRFTRNEEQYDATEFSKNDTIALYVENYENEETMYNRQIFYYLQNPIFINEIGYKHINNEVVQYQEKIYLSSGEIFSAYTGIIEDEENTDHINFEKFNPDLSKYDFNKPKNAVNQQGDFEMKFGEFLIIDRDSYLILENEKSKYSVALYIIEGDETLNSLFENKEALQGKTVFAYHEFVNIGGINRMLYKGSYIAEN